MSYDIVFDGREASLACLRPMYEQEKHSNLRIWTKLTDNHFNLKTFKKMRVLLAAEILTQSVAVAL